MLAGSAILQISIERKYTLKLLRVKVEFNFIVIIDSSSNNNNSSSNGRSSSSAEQIKIKLASALVINI